MLRIGLFGITMGPCASPGASARVAAVAESLGYDSVWAPEHAVLPSPRPAGSPLGPTYPILDPVTTLAHVAAVTSRILLATGVLLIPQHRPALLSKQLVTVDALSNGRLVLGVGVGYLADELRAAGVELAQRGALADEHLAALRSLWIDARPHCVGDHVRITGVDAHPRPARIPVLVGGGSNAALRRAVRYGAGWYGFMLDRSTVAARLESLRAIAHEHGRDPEELEISVTPTEPLSESVIAEYAALGVHRLVVAPPGGFWRGDWSLSDFLAFVSCNAPEAVGATSHLPTGCCDRT